MPGIRIHHPTLRACTLLVPHPGGGDRKAKDYHIRLDGHGNAIVSETVWERLQEARRNGYSDHQLLILNDVPHPPTLRISADVVDEQRMFRQIRAAVRELAPRGTNVRIERGR